MEESLKKEYKQSKLIGDILIEKGVIKPEQLKRALDIQGNQGGYICTIIIKSGFAKPQTVLQVLSEQLGVEYIDLKKEAIDAKAVEKVPVKLALHYKLFPYKIEGKKLVVALSDPLNMYKLDDLKLLLDTEIKAVLSYEDDILDSIRRFYGLGADIVEDIMTRGGLEERVRIVTPVIEDLEAAVEDASIIKFVNQIFTQAVEERATDIHFEPYEDELKIRFRIDGFLYEVPVPESIKLFNQAIISRIKIMANLDIAEHRLPQDGRIKIRIKGYEVDLRVSILPSYLGEAVQIRILSTKSDFRIDNLGLLPEDCNKIETLISKPYGIIFATGPTGSGKSTTLYAALNKKNLPHMKIITTEDPVEYQIKGITQIQINPRVGLSFAACLRSILRHDPDIIMVGEVRDLETAEITIRSAMTGHLVFSTLHTNDAPSTPLRLIDMGVEPFLAASSLEGVIAQRLVRIICSECKEEASVPADLFRKEGLEIGGDSVKVLKGKGCQSCRNTGYKERTAIFEIMLMKDEIRNMIFKGVTSQAIKEQAIKLGMRTLRQDGLRKVLEGITTLFEVLRVT
ncbi:MAG: ATPase, T2SS/T4P/T4SS family [Candidatus Omnitrophota bacterium]